MDLRQLGERGAIDRLRSALGGTQDLGRGGDDCAVVPIGGGGLLLVSTDVLVGPTHVLPGATGHLFGRFSVETAVSDIAAMGGEPLGVLTAIAMPPATDLGWLDDLASGMAEAAERLGVSVLGGDTKASPAATVAVTALGLSREGRCLFRHAGRPGDVLVLTGPLGGPAMGFNMQRDGRGRCTPDALRMVYGVRARVDAGAALSASGHARACIDLSDGLAPSLHQMVEASGCGAVLEWEALPLAPGLPDLASQAGLDLQELALHWGGEYELLASVDPAGIDAVMEALRSLGGEARAVGRLEGGRETILVRDGLETPLDPHGFDHFRGG